MLSYVQQELVVLDLLAEQISLSAELSMKTPL